MGLVVARFKANRKEIIQVILHAADLWNSFLENAVGSRSLGGCDVLFP